MLKIKLECKLYFALIILTIARGRDLSKVPAGVVQRAGSGHNAIAKESRIGEIRMIGQIEEFRAELQPESLGKGELFEKREIKTMKTGSSKLTRPAAQGTVVRLTNGSR